MDIFNASGYWKDDNTEFNDHIIVESDSTPEGYDDDQIFYYGLSESDLKNSTIEDSLEFVITNYEKI